MDMFFKFMMNLFNEILAWIIHDRNITPQTANAPGVTLMYEHLRGNLYLIRPITRDDFFLVVESRTAGNAFGLAAKMFKAIGNNDAVNSKGGTHVDGRQGL